MIRREGIQKVVFWLVICVLFIKDFFLSLQSIHKILDNHALSPDHLKILYQTFAFLNFWKL